MSVPDSLNRLESLTRNLWWSWTPDARMLFETMDPTLWRLSHHNPVKLLQDLKPERLATLAHDQVFLRQCEAVTNAFDQYMAREGTWYSIHYPNLADRTIAYFSAEFGLHSSVPIYSGGLGILAGDHCKEASDLGVPLVGVGFMYPHGYFRQRITVDGWQEAQYEPFNRLESPINQAVTPSGQPCRVSVRLAERVVTIQVWQIQVGRVILYLLDTDIPDNSPADRALSARLYGGDQEVRLCQEILLGIGGVRVLRALGLSPSAWHANEGHSAFLSLELCRELVQGGSAPDDAIATVRRQAIFTTHTPVPAGHDIFPVQVMERYFSSYWAELGLTREGFLRLGEHPEYPTWGFNMTVLALRMSARANAVSREHGRVTRKMWRNLWPEHPEDQVPIQSITNGVHAPTWVASEIYDLYTKYLGRDWSERADDPAVWQGIAAVPERELWGVRQTLKRKLMSFIRERARAGWMQWQLESSQVLACGTLLDPEALTIGFARRFATYKRATLIFSALTRLQSILHNRWRPVQIIFAGKAHPADEPGRQFMHQIYNLCKDHGLGGHVAFLPDYDMHMAKYLVQGVDVWLNTPRPPMEASGTSGQKAAINGVLNLSVLDGWWHEGFDGANGWAISTSTPTTDWYAQDVSDAEQLYRILEEDVVPLYYLRDRDDIPRGWVQIIKDAIRTIGPRFCARRMVKEYMDRMYASAMERDTRTSGA